MERGGEGEVYGKSIMGAYTTICKIDSQQELKLAVWLRKLKRGSVSTSRGGMRREVQEGGDICIPGEGNGTPL